MVENQLDNTQEIISVSEINKRAKSILEENFPFVWIQGEVSNFFSAASGHWYFSLKDESSEIRCAMFTNKNHHITFEPKDGDHLVLNGTLSIFEGRGQYQIIVEHIEFVLHCDVHLLYLYLLKYLLDTCLVIGNYNVHFF